MGVFLWPKAENSARKNTGIPWNGLVVCFGVSWEAYYRWPSRKKSTRELENKKIAEFWEQIHTVNPTTKSAFFTSAAAVYW